MISKSILAFIFSIAIPWFGATDSVSTPTKKDLPLFYWQEDPFVNFGDYISRALVERIVQSPVRCYLKKSKNQDRKLLAIGSILYFANEDDILWGTGVNGKTPDPKIYNFKHLDVRSVRGPYTAKFLRDHFQMDVPEIYGDPALLFPYFFPEFKKRSNPSREYSIVLHYSDLKTFPKSNYEQVMDTSQPWYEIVEQILDSKFIVSTALHAIVIAEAYGIPARLLRVSESPHNNILKYKDYYSGTGRPNFQFATSVEQALVMGGEPPFECDLQKLYSAFPFEFWPNVEFQPLDFSNVK